MSIEIDFAKQFSQALIGASGGSIIFAGMLGIIGIGILMKKLEMGLSSGVMLAVLLLGFLSLSVDSRTLLGVSIGGNFGIFRILYLLLIIGGAIYWAFFLRRK